MRKEGNYQNYSLAHMNIGHLGEIRHLVDIVYMASGDIQYLEKSEFLISVERKLRRLSEWAHLPIFRKRSRLFYLDNRNIPYIFSTGKNASRQFQSLTRTEVSEG